MLFLQNAQFYISWDVKKQQKGEKDSMKNQWKTISIIVMLLFLGQSILRSTEKKELRAEIASLQETVAASEEALEEKDAQITENERDLKNYSNNLAEQEGRYSQLLMDFNELKTEKTVPVYYCRHNESSMVSKVRAMLYCCYGIDDGNRCEHGIVISPSTVEMLNAWFEGLDELVGYTNIEFEEYIWEAWSDEQIEAYYDELDANGVNLNEAIIENLETGQNIREAMLNAMRDTDYGSKSLPASGGSE